VTSISLVVATIDRVEELERLLASLEEQTFKDFEVLIVDQNLDDHLLPVLERHRALTILHLQSVPGLSRARNIGLREAKGQIVAFPDDDCWYPNTLLESVTRWFEDHPEYDGLFTSMRNADNKPMVPKWPPPAGVCTRDNVWDCTVSFTAFLRRRLVDAVGEFNERLGLGADAPYQASEDIDYFIRPLTLGFRMWYEPELVVHHPESKPSDVLSRRAYPFGLAYGYVLGLNGYSRFYWLRRIARSFGGMMLALCRADVTKARLYWLRATGQFRGYISGRKERRHLDEQSTRSSPDYTMH
jgi:glycosyltransferase involved in cell wall biosynthesis